MHILVLGATGPSGIAFVDQALKAGHRLTLYVRNPSKLDNQIWENSNVDIIQGTFEDDAALQRALNSGATVLVSFAGPTTDGSQNQPITRFYEDKLFPGIRKSSGNGVRRALILGTPSVRVAEDRSSLRWLLMVWLIKTLFGDAYREITGMGRAVFALPLDEIEWTMFRVPWLTNGEAKPVRAGMIKHGDAGLLLSRRSIAVWLLQELEERKWIGKAPALCNPGWI